jgi:cytochrome b6
MKGLRSFFYCISLSFFFLFSLFEIQFSYTVLRGSWFTYLNKVYDWFEEGLEIQAIADDITSKYVPPHVNKFYCDGGI